MTENEDELGMMAAERLDLVHETRRDLDALYRQLVRVEGRKDTGLTLMRAHGLLGELEEFALEAFKHLDIRLAHHHKRVCRAMLGGNL